MKFSNHTHSAASKLQHHNEFYDFIEGVFFLFFVYLFLFRHVLEKHNKIFYIERHLHNEMHFDVNRRRDQKRL